MDDVELKTLTADGLKLMEELKKIRKFVRRNSTGSEVSDNESDNESNDDNLGKDRDGQLLTELKKGWAKAKKEEERKKIAEQIEKKQEEKVRQNRLKFITAIYKDKDVMNQAKSLRKKLLDARDNDVKRKKQDLKELEERIERLKKGQSKILSPEVLKERLEDLKKRRHVVDEKLKKQRAKESSSADQDVRQLLQARRRGKQNRKGKQTPTDKELELDEWETIYKKFMKEVSRRDSEGNFNNDNMNELHAYLVVCELNKELQSKRVFRLKNKCLLKF